MKRNERRSSYRITRRICLWPRRLLRLSTYLAIFFAFLLNHSIEAFAQGNFDAYLAEAVRAQSAGNIPGAVSAYQNALAIKRDAPEVWANLGLMQHQLQDYAGALKSFRTAHQLQPKLFVPILFLGLETLQLGNKTDAVRYLLMAQQIHSNDPEIHMNLGRAYFDLGQFENASAAYRRATDLDRKSGEAWYRLGITYLEMSEVASGELVKLNRQSPYLLRLHAESLDDQDKLTAATEVYRKLLLDPDLPQCTRSSFGLLLLRSGNPSEAQSEFQRDVVSGGCLLADVGLIRLSLANGDTEAAMRKLASLWTLDSGFVRAHAFLLTRDMTAIQLGDFDRTLSQPEAGILPSEEIGVLRTSLRGGRTLSLPANGSRNPETATVTSPPTPLVLYTQGKYAKCEKSLFPAISSLSRDKLSLLAACSFFTGDFETTLVAAKRLRRIPQGEESGLSGPFWRSRS